MSVRFNTSSAGDDQGHAFHWRFIAPQTASGNMTTPERTATTSPSSAAAPTDPAPGPDIVRPGSPAEEPQPDLPVGIPAPGPDMTPAPAPNEIPSPRPQEIPIPPPRAVSARRRETAIEAASR
jgi:hypothetical protein